MTVDFPPETSKRLDWLKEQLEAPSRMEVLRNSLKLLEACLDAKAKGGRVEIVYPDGRHVGIYVPDA